MSPSNTNTIPIAGHHNITFAQPERDHTALPLYVLHMDDEDVADIVGGRLVVVKPGEVYEFTNRFFGRKFIEHKWMHGVVEVKVVRDRSGIHFGIDEAVEASVLALERADEQYSQDYIQTQHNDRLAQAKPALPPSPRQRKILDRRQINLESHGIVPIGAKSNMERIMESVMQQNQLLIAVLAGKLDASALSKIGQINTPEPTPPPKPSPVATPSAPTSISTAQVVPESAGGGTEVLRNEEGVISDAVARQQLGIGPDEDVDSPDQVPGPSAPLPTGEAAHPKVDEVRARRLARNRES